MSENADGQAEGYETIVYEVAGPVATITLNRPEHLNTIVPPLPDEVEAAVAAATGDDRVKTIVVRGAGRSFCAGYDFGGGFEHWDEQITTDGRWDPGKDFAFATTPSARWRGPTTASPPLVRRSATTGRCGADTVVRRPSPSMRVTRIGPAPVPTRTVRASASSRVRLQSSCVRRRAAVVMAAGLGEAASIARASARTASASRVSAARTAAA